MTTGKTGDGIGVTPADHDRGSFAPVNSVTMYYETYGTGEPLILVHGGLGTIDMFAELIPLLAKERQVIAVELQGHGHTEDIDRPFSFEQLADDVAGLIKHLDLEQADILGLSLGGGVALQSAIRHPDVVRKLVVLSAPLKRQGWYPEVLAGMASIDAGLLAGTPPHQHYASIAPRPDDWPVLIAKTRQLLAQEYDWSADVAAFQMPVLLVIGDADSIPVSHAAEFFELLGGSKRDGGMGGRPASRLAVIPGATHLTMMAHVDQLVGAISPFLNARQMEG